MIVEGGNDFVVRSSVEDFPDLLKKTLSVQRRCTHKSVFSKQNVLSFKSSVEIFVQEVKGFVFSSIQNYFYCILQVDLHLVLF